MSGETRTYRLNDPMKWAEFKKMPDDIKITYLKLLRERYNVTFTKIGEMLGVSSYAINNTARRLGISEGKGRRAAFDAAGWERFINGEKAPAEETPAPITPGEIVKKAIPLSGQLQYKGNPAAVFAAALEIIGGAEVDICITWQPIGGADNG